ncbi:hypothetical protein [Lapidilactobacillus wuchangensis]|uniref:hypothetical protein n=1 Tax=Lapidilactobacillus wuchangensis TaxID=2486001 RepID=UPI000F7998C3|nr:hypothetical protein [Lapidilactobacillus wuchangensis]
MKTGGKITLLAILTLLVATGVTAGVVSHNHQVKAQQVLLVRQQQAKKVAQQSEQQLKKQAEKLVQAAYQSRNAADIATAQTAIKRLTKTDRINLTTQLTTLDNLLAQAKAADTAVTQAEQSRTEADIKAAQKLVDLQLDPFFKKDRVANQKRLDNLGSSAAANTTQDNSMSSDQATADQTAIANNDTTASYDNSATDQGTATNSDQTSNQTWWWPATDNSGYQDTTGNTQTNTETGADTSQGTTTETNTTTTDSTSSDTSANADTTTVQ